MTDYWPIETAPKDREILAWWPIYEGEWAITLWDEDNFSKKPRPHWGSYRLAGWGKQAQRDHQPTHWREKLLAPAEGG